MVTNPRYDRDKLISLLAERAAFERAALGLYDALLRVTEEADAPEVTSAIEALRQHREEEREHAEWVERLLEKLGGKPTRELVDVVSRVTRALASVIGRKADGALLPALHAILAVELMDKAGWDVLEQVAEKLGDEDAVHELRRFVERESEHLTLARELMVACATESVRYRPEAREPEHVERKGLDLDVPKAARVTTDHAEIREWVEARGGRPARVKGTGGDGDPGILRIDFPGWAGEESLEPIDWDTWLRAFDANGLALVYQEETATGEPSRFNKLVARETARRRRAPTPRRGRPAAGMQRGRGRVRAGRARA